MTEHELDYHLERDVLFCKRCGRSFHSNSAAELADCAPSQPSQAPESGGAVGRTEPMLTSVAPPLGVMPRWLHNEHRSADLLRAMLRYVEAGKAMPVEWFDELSEYVHAVPRVE